MPDADRQAGGDGDEADARDVHMPTVEEMEAEICREVLAVHDDSFGGAADNARAHVLDDLVVVLLAGLELAPSEQFLIESGRSETVVTLRDHFQQAIEPSFSAIVERATGRRVTGFTSHLQLGEEPYAVEVFRLDS